MNTQIDAFNGDYYSGVAQDNYEQNIINEARDIVAGLSSMEPTVEHLRITLEWLDGGCSSTPQENLF